MLTCEGLTCGLVERDWSVEGRSGITRRVSLAVEGAEPLSVVLTDGVYKSLGKDYELLRKFGTHVRCEVEPRVNTNDAGQARLTLRCVHLEVVAGAPA